MSNVICICHRIITTLTSRSMKEYNCYMTNSYCMGYEADKCDKKIAEYKRLLQAESKFEQITKESK